MTADLDTLSPADRLKIRASDYDRVVAALDFLSEHWREQPDLAAAAFVGDFNPSRHGVAHPSRRLFIVKAAEANLWFSLCILSFEVY